MPDTPHTNIVKFGPSIGFIMAVYAVELAFGVLILLYLLSVGAI